MKFIVKASSKTRPPHPAAVLAEELLASWYDGTLEEADREYGEVFSIYTIEVRDLEHLRELGIVCGKRFVIDMRPDAVEDACMDMRVQDVERYKDTPLLEVYDAWRE